MKTLWISLLLFAAAAPAAFAEDTELYTGAQQINTGKPNVVFIIDTSTSMDNILNVIPQDWAHLGDLFKTRIAIIKRASKEVIDETTGINLAIMRFSRNGNYYDKCQALTAIGTLQDKCYRGGYLITPMLDIDGSSTVDGVTKTNKQILKDLIESDINTEKGKDPATGWRTIINETPIVESVHEAYNFIQGNAVDYGKRRNTHFNTSDWRVWNWYWQADDWRLLSHPGTVVDASDIANARYKSPVADQCQKNHIVLFTDGASTFDGESDGAIRSMLVQRPGRPGSISTSCSTKDNGIELNFSGRSCLPELAYSMNKNLPGQYQIHFHAIAGFLLQLPSARTILKDAATNGGGNYNKAENYEEIKESIKATFRQINDSSGSYAAPTVTVSAFNSLEQLDELYYSVFKPHEGANWAGNLKRYRLTTKGILDAEGSFAVDPVTGFFSKNARSFWTLEADGADGDDARKGGAASRFTAASGVPVRNVMTNLSGLGALSPISSITKASANASSMTNDEFDLFKKWLSGLNTKEHSDSTDARRTMEDPLHSQPVVLNYHVTGEPVSSTVFVGTNSGYLHAFDTNVSDPKEHFAFIPKELLPIAKDYYDGAASKRYGLDGAITVYHKDTNNNRIVDNSEKAILYVGMRRGGYSYYALDVSNRDTPRLLWQINGKKHADGPSPDFAELGQTWSKMVPINIMWQGSKKRALVFAGGYDPKEDHEPYLPASTKPARTTHSMGNAVYLVDAETGSLLWKASPSASGKGLQLTDMTSAIVGNVVPVDNQGRGYIDLLYVADLGGRIWRFDLDPTAYSATSYATGGMIADLGSDSSAVDNTRFYTSLDVAYSKAFSHTEVVGGTTTTVSNDPHYTLSIGSGYREHPLDKNVKDNFFVLFDYNVSATPPATYSAVTRSNLEKYSFSGGTLDLTPTAKTKNGFYVELQHNTGGEKILSRAITLSDTIYVSSFVPPTSPFDLNCKPNLGTSKLYTINLKERKVTKRNTIPQGIPSDPSIVIPKAENPGDVSKPSLLISTELIDIDSNPGLKRTYWRETK